jgi:heme oxygenase
MNLPSLCKGPDGYGRALRLLYGFFEPLETRLLAVPALSAVVPGLESRMRSRLLEMDLACLGLPAPAIRQVPRCSELPGLTGAAEALGCLYVLEGSTLGGQIMAREIVAMDPALAPACRFLRCDGEDVGLRWKGFAAALEGYCGEHPGDSDTLCDSAIRTFRLLESWIESRTIRG